MCSKNHTWQISGQPLQALRHWDRNPCSCPGTLPLWWNLTSAQTPLHRVHANQSLKRFKLCLLRRGTANDRANIIACKKHELKAVILIPTIRFEAHRGQPDEVHEEERIHVYAYNPILQRKIPSRRYYIKAVARDRDRWEALCRNSTPYGRRGLTKWSEVMFVHLIVANSCLFIMEETAEENTHTINLY